MRIVTLLSWFDEDPVWLKRCIESLAKVPVDHVVAVDGPYGLFPAAVPRSHPEQARMIRAACNRIGASCTVHIPGAPWDGGEVEKRTSLFQLAETVTTPADWYMVVDADETVQHAPADVRGRLQATPFDVGAVTLNEPGHALGTVTFATYPMFFRAIRGLTVRGNHFTYVTPDGRKLWGDAKRDRLEPRGDLADIVVEHRKQFRPPGRKEAQMGYYRNRDEAGMEELAEDRRVLAA